MFRIYHESYGETRVGEIKTSRGSILTPAFMPVATKGFVKAVSPNDLLEVGTQALISNAFHIYLRPGIDFVESIGGIHKFVGLEIPIFTDSGGFQAIRKDFSIKITREGFIVKDHLFNTEILYTPELCAEIQRRLGVDVALTLDLCAPYPPKDLEELSYFFTVEWAKEFRRNYDRAAVGIIQGGFNIDYREKCAIELTKIGFEGYAIGGLSIGEPKEITHKIVREVVKFIPKENFRYLMGVGSPVDIVLAVESGIDLFDSSYPTRNARHGSLLTWSGKINIKRKEYRYDHRPIDENCSCYTCRNFSRAYLHFLYSEKEISVKRLLTIHNLHFMNEFFSRMRKEIIEDNFIEFKNKVFQIYYTC